MPSAVSETLRGLPHFRKLDDETLDKLVAGSRMLRLSRGEPIIREGEACRGFFVVRTGGARIFRLAADGREQLLRRVRPGQAFAEAAVLSMPCYPASVVATEDGTEVVEVGGNTFLRLFEHDRRLARSMVSALSIRLHHLLGRVEQLSVMSAGARLARYLLDLPSSGPAETPTVQLPTTKKDLAADLGITPETLSRVLRRWQDRDLVRSERGRVVLLDVDTLLAIATA